MSALLVCLLTILIYLPSGYSENKMPNIVVILADDMGFGELRILNPEKGKVPTPQLDAIACGGMIFIDGHSGSSVCTPLVMVS